MTVHPWPPELRAVGIAFDLAGQAITGPLTLFNTRQVGSLNGGHWIATLAEIAVVGRDAMLAYRRLRSLLQGGAHQVRVPVCDRANAPWPGSERSAYATFSDTATFSDGGRFSQGVIAVSVVSIAAVRTTRLEVDLVDAGAIVGGERFSINGHLHEIAQVLDEAAPSGATAVWRIVPPLREAVGPETHLEFDNPVCTMTLARESELNMMTWRNRTGMISPSFVESFEA